MAILNRCVSSITKSSDASHFGLRTISTSRVLLSGHNRWSKIKHDKVKEDAVRSKERSQWARSIQDAIKRNGEDVNSNSELSTLVAQAKKAGLPKEIIERAIAKARGVSLSGDALETVTLEAMLPPSISAIIECRTDNKNRTLGDLRLLVKNVGGTVTPTSHAFERRGRIILESGGIIEEEKVMDCVLELGALDMEIEEDDNSVSVYTEPSQTASIASGLAESLGLSIRNYEIVWVPRPESKVEVDEPENSTQLSFEKIIGRIEEDSSVQAIYHNAM
ncbi:MAG: hypothetical protein Q9216_006419 [Gyalolechia sp. 2 TL-2023]